MLEIIKELRKSVLEIGLEYEGLSSGLDALEEKYEDLKENSILDLDKFKRELETQGLLTDELREFIDRYMQFDNHE